MKFLVKEQGKFEEFSGLPIYLIYPPKVNKNGAQIFQKTSKFLEHNFWLPIQFLLHFYALMFFRYQIRLFFSSKSSILALKNSFYTGQFLVFLVCFSLWGIPCPEIPWFLVPHEELQCVFTELRIVFAVLCVAWNVIDRRSITFFPNSMEKYFLVNFPSHWKNYVQCCCWIFNFKKLICEHFYSFTQINFSWQQYRK